MAWASLNTIGSNQEKAADNAITLAVTAGVEVGNVVVILIACNNASGIDGDNGDISTVTDAGSNVYTKAREFTNGQGAAAAGATVSVWFSKITTALAINDLITVTFSFSPAAKAVTAWEFSAGGVVTVETGASVADDNTDPTALNLTTPNAEFLWVRGIAKENVPGGAFVKTLAYASVFTQDGTTGAGAASNMSIGGEHDIFTGTTNESDPGWNDSASDHASVLVALKEEVATAPVFEFRVPIYG